MGYILDVIKTGLGLLNREQEEFLAKGREPVRPWIPSSLSQAMHNVDADDDRRKITLARSGNLNAPEGQYMEFVRTIRREFAAGNRTSFISTNGTVRCPPFGETARIRSEMRVAMETLDAHGYTGGPPPNVQCHDAIRTLVRLDAGLWGSPGQPFGKRPTPPPAAPRMPIEDMVTAMVPKRDSGLLADIIRVRMAGGTPQVIDGSEMSATARAVRYALACDSANGSSAAIDWLRAWSEGDATAEKEMEAYENDGD